MQMITCRWELTPLCRFRVPSGKQGDAGTIRSPEEKPFENESDSQEAILCRQCHQVLTDPSARIRIQGAHQHTFANPHGVVFQIGCFHPVRGCGYVGPAISEWSWFKGYSWRILVCRTCLTHLGWVYLAGGDESFCGLILDRIVETSSNKNR